MTPVTPLCAQQSRKPTTEISLTCIHSVFSIMQCVSGEKKKMCLGFFFFFFQTWPTNKRCQAFVSFVRVVLFSCVSLLAGLLQGPGGRVATGHSSDSEAYSAPPGGRAPSQKCCDCGRAVWTEAPGKLVLPSLCFCAASPSGLEVAA